MSDFETVTRALAAGTGPALLCATCPWDRNCLTPPSITRDEIEAQIRQAAEDDKVRSTRAVASGQPAGMPLGALITTVMIAGKDTSAAVCPVLALRLRSSGGRKIADQFKAMMQGWDDQA